MRRRDILTGAAVLALSAFAARAKSGSRPMRIVTLGGDVTEIVFALGEGARVVGRDATSKYPSAAAALPDVGYFRQLGAEGVLSLRPDLILAAASAGPPEVLSQIQSAGVRIMRLPEEHSAAALLSKVWNIARAIETPDQGEALASSLQAQIEKASASIAAMGDKPRVLFIIASSNGGSTMAAGRDTAADALISLAGGINVFASHSGYRPISLEAAIAAAPDAIGLMAHTLEAMGGVEGVSQHPALKLTPAARTKRIFGRDGSYLLSFGPRLPQAMTDFAKAIRERNA